MTSYFIEKKTIVILLISVLYNLGVKCQDQSAENYLKNTGDYATLYSGRVEAIYNPNKYENLPYFQTPEFMPGEIKYRDRIYSKQQVRLDLYKEQVIVLSPEKHYGIVLNSKYVEYVSYNNCIFVWHESSKGDKLKSGFYMQLHAGKKMELYSKQVLILNERLTVSNFTSKTYYYLFMGDEYYAVKNKGSFIKLFPQYKVQINQFVKGHVSDFGRSTEFDLILLAQFCEGLLSSK